MIVGRYVDVRDPIRGSDANTVRVSLSSDGRITIKRTLFSQASMPLSELKAAIAALEGDNE